VSSAVVPAGEGVSLAQTHPVAVSGQFRGLTGSHLSRRQGSASQDDHVTAKSATEVRRMFDTLNLHSMYADWG
jgi:hypothetical protein